jgi:hypothetical protein
LAWMNMLHPAHICAKRNRWPKLRAVWVNPAIHGLEER